MTPAEIRETTLAERFRAAIAARGLNGEQTAKALGCTPGYVNQIFKGRSVPTLDKLHAIALVLEIDPAELDPRLASKKPP